MNNYCKHVFRAARRLSHNVRLLYYNMEDNNMYSVYAQGQYSNNFSHLQDFDINTN